MARFMCLIANFSLNTFNLIDNYVQMNTYFKLEERKEVKIISTGVRLNGVCFSDACHFVIHVTLIASFAIEKKLLSTENDTCMLIYRQTIDAGKQAREETTS